MKVITGRRKTIPTAPTMSKTKRLKRVSDCDLKKDENNHLENENKHQQRCGIITSMVAGEN